MKKTSLTKRSFPLGKKLNVMIAVIMLPFTVLVIYLLASMINYCNSYSQIVRNVTEANNYNIHLRDEINSAMYQISAGSTELETIEERQGIRNPYDVLKEARRAFTGLQDTTTAPGNNRRIKRIIKSFDTLRKRMDEVVADTRESGHYDENIVRLEHNIYILTEVLEEAIQEYIYYETLHLESIRQELELKEDKAVRVSIVCLALVVGGALMVALHIAGSVAKPISDMCRTTEDVSSGNFDVRVQVNSSDETAVLAESFNSMIERMGRMVESIKQEQRNLRNTELKLLQAQINPHFLYNTLDTVMWLAEAGQKEQVISMVSSLSDFFRTTLSRGKDCITVRDEVSHIKSYLEIQRFRYQDIMDYRIEVPEELFGCSILKLMLQPLVENALYHGIKNKRGRGMITVKGKRQGERLIFTVEDDGMGMPPEKLSLLEEKLEGRSAQSAEEEGFGLVNVNERIRLNYGKEYGLAFKSVFGEGTIVTVTLPIKK